MADPSTLNPNTPPGFTRRDFLRGSGIAATATALVAPTPEAEAARLAAGEAVGPAATPITLSINGKSTKLSVEPRVTLLDALRNHLDMTGAKKVCDRATCGSCTVLVDGKPTYACSVLAIECVGSQVTTVESLGVDNPIVRAFTDHDASQCGFCTPGFVMACHALLQSNPHPTPEQVQDGLGGNLCRCGTYYGIRAAMQQVAGKGGRS